MATAGSGDYKYPDGFLVRTQRNFDKLQDELATLRHELAVRERALTEHVGWYLVCMNSKCHVCSTLYNKKHCDMLCPSPEELLAHFLDRARAEIEKEDADATKG